MTGPQVPVKFAETNLFGILLAVFVLLVTLVVFALHRRRKGSRNAVLLTGLCDSGKTTIHTVLAHQRIGQTYTSMKENIGTIKIDKRTLKIIDIPGHERLREKFLEQYKGMSWGIVFVIDSVNLQQNIRDAGEYLYNILVDPVMCGNNANVLVLCNKQDLATSKGCNVIKASLEKELNQLRITKLKQLDSLDPKARRMASLGDADKKFSFDDLPFKVEFGESSAYSDSHSANLKDLEQWLLTRLKYS